MEVILDGIGRLTTEHAASSYGQPVLVVEDEEGSLAVGPGDPVTVEGETMTGAAAVRAWLWFNRDRLTDEEREFAEAFAGMAPRDG